MHNHHNKIPDINNEPTLREAIKITSSTDFLLAKALKKLDEMSKEEFCQECIKAGYTPKDKPSPSMVD